MNYIIAYDITEDKIRNKVARLLEKNGLRLQKSVFSVKCEKYTFEKILRQIEKILSIKKNENDSVIVFRLCKGCENKSIYTGKRIEKFYII